MNAGAEERRGANGSPGERRALRAVVLSREADDARLDDAGAVNAADEVRGILRASTAPWTPFVLPNPPRPKSKTGLLLVRLSTTKVFMPPRAGPKAMKKSSKVPIGSSFI